MCNVHACTMYVYVYVMYTAHTHKERIQGKIIIQCTYMYARYMYMYMYIQCTVYVPPGYATQPVEQPDGRFINRLSGCFNIFF